MRNLNFWFKLFILSFWSSYFLRLQRPCKLKPRSFHQYLWNSEVETTWISLIGWPHRTSSLYYFSRWCRAEKNYIFQCAEVKNISIGISRSVVELWFVDGTPWKEIASRSKSHCRHLFSSVFFLNPCIK